MPSTYNGIGTHYYGKKNIEKRAGPCPHCHRAVDLISYDTRKWFVIFFIPIIPLGRKRIVDYCAACTRHYAVDAQKWETAKQLEISGALDEYRARPSPESAIAVHQQFLKFHQATQAAEFQKKMAEQYADNAKVQAYLAAALDHLGHRDEAVAYYARALELRPDLPEVRIGVAYAHIRAGKLDEARALLDFLEKQGAAHLYSLEPLETLAIALQKEGRHLEALELFNRLLAELPHLAQVKQFRDRVTKSETTLGRKESSLPAQKFSWKRFFGLEALNRGQGASPQFTWRSLALVGGIAGVIALGLVIANEHIRRHRKIYFVNAFPQPARVQVAGQGTIAVRRLSEMVLPEGRYRAVISGPIQEQVDFEVRSSYFSRWAADPVWVINVGSAAVLMSENVTYGNNPPPATFNFHYGKPFEYFSRVTHPFLDLPESLRMKSHEKRTLVHLDFLDHASGLGAFQYELEHGSADAPALAEGWLRAHPDDKPLLRAYTQHLQKRQPERASKFFRAGLTNRPVHIEWHRSYQRLHEKQTDLATITAEYDEMLRRDPTNASLLYLRGRIAADHHQGRQLFEQAVAADPKNAFAHFGLGFDRLEAGEWAGAREHLAQAAALAPEEPYFRQALLLARLALGETSALEQEFRQSQRQKPLDYVLEVSLLEVLLAEGNRDATLSELADFGKRWQREYGPRGQSSLVGLKRFALYGLGDFAELEKSVAKDKSAEARRMFAAALIEQGRLDESLKLSSAEMDPDEQPWHHLELGIALRHAGKVAEANECVTRAAKLMSEGSSDLVRAAALLTRSTPPIAGELEDIVLPPQAKAIYLTAVGQKFPETSPQLFALARKFNIQRSFPYHLLNRVTAAPPAQ